MEEIYSVSSTNGRWGLRIVSEVFKKEDLREPVRAQAVKLGKVEGHEIVRLDKTDKDQWVLVTGDAVPMGGCTEFVGMGLQSNDNVTIIILSSQAIVKTYGYCRRSSTVRFFLNGKKQNVPASVLLALGLLRPVTEEPAEEPPTLEEFLQQPNAKSALQQALLEAGLATGLA